MPRRDQSGSVIPNDGKSRIDPPLDAVEDIGDLLSTDIGIEKVYWSLSSQGHHCLSHPMASLVVASKHFAGCDENPRDPQAFLGLIRGKHLRLPLPESLGIDAELVGQGFLADAKDAGYLIERLSGDALADRLDLLKGWHCRHRGQACRDGLAPGNGDCCHEGKVAVFLPETNGIFHVAPTSTPTEPGANLFVERR